MAGARPPASLKLERGISRFRALFLATREAPCILPSSDDFQPHSKIENGIRVESPIASTMGRINKSRKIAVLLADDHPVVRQGLVSLLRADRCLKVIGEARNGREAVKLAKARKPDVVLMDLGMPVLNGLEATRQILAADPKIKVLILSTQTDAAYVEGASSAGAIGLLEKQTTAGILAKIVQKVASGSPFISPAMAKSMATK